MRCRAGRVGGRAVRRSGSRGGPCRCGRCRRKVGVAVGGRRVPWGRRGRLERVEVHLRHVREVSATLKTPEDSRSD